MKTLLHSSNWNVVTLDVSARLRMHNWADGFVVQRKSEMTVQVYNVEL